MGSVASVAQKTLPLHCLVILEKDIVQMSVKGSPEPDPNGIFMSCVSNKRLIAKKEVSSKGKAEEGGDKECCHQRR
jgi:hypothetical protein